MNFKAFLGVLIGLLLVQGVQAGNPDRAGQAGASELLVNPWARSLGLNGVNIASVRGIDAMRINVAGLTFIDQTQVGFSRSEYLVGSDIGINALGFGQKLGDGALGLSIMNVSYGDIEITTTSQPEGNIGSYTPQFLNIGAAYSRSFADFIHGGVVVRIVNESIANLSATGVAIDAGLIYTTGTDAHPNRFKFGVSLRNVGTPMTFQGDGLKFTTEVISGQYEQKAEQITQAFELPSQLNIGASYDVHPGEKHRITFNGSFTSNAFYRDQFGGGLEYGFKINDREVFMLRAAYKYENDIFDDELRRNVHTGLAAGFTVDIPFSQDQEIPRMGIDYAYRTSDPFDGSHTVGVRLDF